MKFEAQGFRKFGLAGLVCGILLTFIGTSILTDPIERMMSIGGILGLTAIYLLLNVLQKKVLNGNNTNGDDPPDDGGTDGLV